MPIESTLNSKSVSNYTFMQISFNISIVPQNSSFNFKNSGIHVAKTYTIGELDEFSNEFLKKLD
ncbi:uncharacterized membrane protein YoaK (UPF0700 family) [Aureibacter tunicatorum]|uniref:Uncharacterized membrane protein YoaK (UPF0700 family) n=1 Tax=Aureibacter tunicatorum TaxID=866807 RepID=A0AAE3XRG1_9BACT|nr:uncharacterized membrane protein YoaK (UPF0700 family) [Aureibacter tunicatorum]BDD06598.1 hypothetical protein AUTU_40810 [Aureibacter tunicatorum]